MSVLSERSPDPEPSVTVIQGWTKSAAGPLRERATCSATEPSSAAISRWNVDSNSRWISARLISLTICQIERSGKARIACSTYP